MTELPTGWAKKKMGEIGRYLNGKAFKSQDWRTNGRPIIRIQNLTGSGDEYNYFQGEIEERYVVKPGDLLFSWSATLGTYIWQGPEAVLNQHIFKVESLIDKRFHRYLLDFKIQEMLSRTHGSGMVHITKKSFDAIEVIIPPLPEQQQIVEILEDHLSRLDAALADVKQAKLKAAQFRHSLLQAAFTGNLPGDGTRLMTEISSSWEIKRLGDCLEKLKSGKKAERGWSPQCLSNPSPDENVWGVLKTTAVQMGQYEPEHNKQLPDSLEPKVGLEVNPGDFLVTTTGPRNRCGIVCHVRETRKRLIFSGKILRFRADEKKVLSSWLMYLLMSPDYQVTLDEMKVGTSDSSVSIGNQQILDLQIPVPPLLEQQKIVEILEDHLSRLDASVAIADEMEKQFSSLRRSLLQAAFTGQLTKEVASV